MCQIPKLSVVMNSSISMTMKLSRRLFRRTVARLRFGSLSGYPILFANGFPKSGTHLLVQVMKGFTKLGPAVDSGLPAIAIFDGTSGNEKPLGEIIKEINRLRSGDIAFGHLHALPEIVDVLTSRKTIPFFIYRDPRDVVVSHAFYVSNIEINHVHHDHYGNVLKTFDERLMTSILGIPGSKTPFPDISKRFEPYLGWLDYPQTLSIRYEDFILDLVATLTCVIDFAKNNGFPLQVPQEEAISHLRNAINPDKSPTFRTGKIGKWQEYFNEVHIRVFKDVCGDLLIRLGYEKDKNW